jgi:hypothetical protein
MSMENNAKFSDHQSALDFILGGNASFTLKSLRTGARYTYRARRSDDEKAPVYFIALLTGPENTHDYEFIGTVFPGDAGDTPVFRHGRKSRIGQDAPGVAAFRWAFAHLAAGDMHSQLEVWHEGRCGRCGRTLTVPESVASGFGPECINHVHHSHAGA